MTRIERAIERTLKRLAKEHEHLGSHQGYQALSYLLLELRKTGEEHRQAACLHRCRRLGPEARPYRYQCVVCRKRLKVASGVVLEAEKEAIA